MTPLRPMPQRATIFRRAHRHTDAQPLQPPTHTKQRRDSRRRDGAAFAAALSCQGRHGNHSEKRSCCRAGKRRYAGACQDLQWSLGTRPACAPRTPDARAQLRFQPESADNRQLRRFRCLRRRRSRFKRPFQRFRCRKNLPIVAPATPGSATAGEESDTAARYNRRRRVCQPNSKAAPASAARSVAIKRSNVNVEGRPATNRVTVTVGKDKANDDAKRQGQSPHEDSFSSDRLFLGARQRPTFTRFNPLTRIRSLLTQEI